MPCKLFTYFKFRPPVACEMSEMVMMMNGFRSSSPRPVRSISARTGDTRKVFATCVVSSIAHAPSSTHSSHFGVGAATAAECARNTAMRWTISVRAHGWSGRKVFTGII